MKVVINTAVGGFSLSQEAVELYFKKKGLSAPSNRPNYMGTDIPRDDQVLVEVVETLQEKANSDWSKLKIIDIPDDVKWIVCDDITGEEWIAEKHRTWQ